MAVAQERSISKAAALLHLSQPAVSLQIKHLEAAVGLPLFERTPQGFAITKSGTALLSQAQVVLAALQNFSQTAATLQQPARAVLRVGTILDSEFIHLGPFLNALANVSPKIVIELRHGISDDVLAQTTRGELDACFYLDSPANVSPAGAIGRDAAGRPASFLVRPLKTFVYRVVAPGRWRHRVRNMNWRALAALPWLGTPPASANARLLASVFGPLGVKPTHTALATDEGATLDMVESGMGLCLARDDIAQREARRRNLVIVDKVEVACTMSFVCLEARMGEFAIAQSLAAIEKIWVAAGT